MTQISVRTITPDMVSFTAVPRPRDAVLPGPADAVDLLVAPVGVPSGDPVVIDTTIIDSPVLPAVERDVSRPGPRRVSGWSSFSVDATLALALATAFAGLDMLPARVALAAAASWPLLLVATGHYRRRSLGESRAGRVGAVLGMGLRGSVLALAASPWLPLIDLVALAQLVAVIAVASGIHHLVDVGRTRPRLVLAGRQRDVREAILDLEAAGSHEVVAVCLTRSSKSSFDVPTYVGVAAASDAAERHQADALLVLPGARLSPVEMRRLHWALSGIGTELCVGTGLLDVDSQRTRVMSTAGIDVLHVRRAVLTGPRRLLKEIVERSVALVAFVLAMPLLAALCVAIRLETPGKALFRQERIGRNGAPFTMLKLRSMGVDAEDERSGLAARNDGDGVLFKMRLDPRITPLGQRLRRYSLDELPQLWNVVRGDMSLVGPRPALPCEVARYDIDPRRRLVVKPGVTGLWQVSGRSDLSWDESVRLDIKYVDNWSLRLDLMILARTVQAVLGHRGAY